MESQEKQDMKDLKSNLKVGNGTGLVNPNIYPITGKAVYILE